MTIVRVSVTFSLEIEEGNKENCLGLLYTGSTGSLMSEKLVNKFGLETEKNISTWDTNNSKFITGRIATTKNLYVP